MAVLAGSDLVRIRSVCAVRFAPVSYLKGEINNALQAIEDAMTTTTIPAGAVGMTIPQIISTAIDNATTFNFSNAQKKILFALWAELKFRLDIL